MSDKPHIAMATAEQQQIMVTSADVIIEWLYHQSSQDISMAMNILTTTIAELIVRCARDEQAIELAVNGSCEGIRQQVAMIQRHYKEQEASDGSSTHN